MPKKLYEETYINNIALAIQAKNETSNRYYPSQMAQAINDLIWQGTQEEYDELPSINPTTLYIIIEEEE